MRGRLFVRYWLVISGLLTATLLLAGGLEIALAYRENLARIDAVQRAEVRVVAGRVGQALADLERALRDTASLPWQEQLLGLKEACHEFHRLLKVSPPIYEVRALDRQGRLRLRVSRVQPDFGCPDGDAAAQPEGPLPAVAQYIPIRYRNGSEPFTTLRLPVGAAAPLFGAIEADLNLKFVSDVIHETSNSEGRNVYVVDGSDNLVAHTDPGLPLRRMSFAGLPHVAAARKAGSTDGVSQRSTSHDGASVVASGLAIGDSRWMAFVEESQDHVARDAWATARRTAAMILAALLAAVIASYQLARRLTRPIVTLRRSAERMAAGDLGARIDVRTGDEIEALAAEFNRMGAQLQEYTTGLERKVTEKTAELQEADRAKTDLLKRVEKEREAAQVALHVAQDAMRARSLFLAAASHDLRQPLYAVSILADTLAAGSLTEPARRAVEKQREAVGILRDLFDNLLDLSRLEAGEVKPAIRDVALVEALGPLASQCQALCEAKGLAWECDLPEVSVRTDRTLFARAVGNLLHNAVRYTDTGAVSLAGSRLGDRLVVEVSDTGIGIESADQRRVFEEFVQLANASRNRDKGVGLGLSIVKRLSDLLDMRVELFSTPGVGTRVRLSVPVASDMRAEAKPLSSTAAVSRISGMRVWIVEDDRLVSGALAMQLDAWGVDHAFALDRAGILALREADGEWPQAILLDDMLGDGERGLTLANWLVEHLPPQQLALTTGNPGEARLVELEASGIRVLRKPVAADELARWLDSALRTASSA